MSLAFQHGQGGGSNVQVQRINICTSRDTLKQPINLQNFRSSVAGTNKTPLPPTFSLASYFQSHLSPRSKYSFPARRYPRFKGKREGERAKETKQTDVKHPVWTGLYEHQNQYERGGRGKGEKNACRYAAHALAHALAVVVSPNTSLTRTPRKGRIFVPP